MLLSPRPSPLLLVMGRTVHFQCVHCPLGECLGWARAGTVNRGINGGHISPDGSSTGTTSECGQEEKQLVLLWGMGRNHAPGLRISDKLQLSGLG